MCRSYDPSASARASTCWVKLVVPKSWFPFRADDGEDQQLGAGKTPNPSFMPGAECLAERPGVG